MGSVTGRLLEPTGKAPPVKLGMAHYLMPELSLEQ